MNIQNSFLRLIIIGNLNQRYWWISIVIYLYLIDWNENVMGQYLNDKWVVERFRDKNQEDVYIQFAKKHNLK